MKRLHIAVFLVLAGIAAFALAGHAQQQSAAATLDPAAPLTPETAALLSQNADRPVIVLMKNQFTGADAVSDQAPVMSELHQVNAARIKSFKTVNSLAATVSEGEIARLKANPAVALVVPDVIIRKAALPATPSGSSSSSSLTPHIIPGACAPNGQALLEPEALQTTNTDSQDPHAQTARSLGLTGAGVKVAWIADGIDPNNVNFIRSNGKSAFIDYEDFSGDGPGAATEGGEAFIDSNAIAGQGIHVYDVNGFSAQSYPYACNIRIEGVAPGADLVGLKVFSEFNYTTESNFLEAIDYAVFIAHVDVLNESFGSNPFPDETSQDVTKMFNDAAVKAGVVVTVSTGDAGPTNTIGSPSTDPAVISVGASTTFRFYAQTNYAVARYFSTGWLDDNISALSSGGFSQTGGTIDLVAPGDLTWASCDASANYSDCTNFPGAPSDIESSGGTSLSSPLTAGAAALVIEAYRRTHRGATPSPALVKQILTSTATDLGVPTTEQGSGILNSYKAALLAESIGTSDVSPSPFSQSLLLSTAQLNAVAAPGTSEKWPVTVTNTGEFGQLVAASGRTFGRHENVQKGSVTLNDSSSPQFVYVTGLTYNYETFTFDVAPGSDRLEASIAYPSTPTGKTVRFILVDPLGRLAAHSLPQGIGNFGSADVRQPAPGKWTAVVFGITKAAGGVNGAIPWKVFTQCFAPFGSVAPSLFFLAPGHSQTIEVEASTPPTPGDAAGSVVLTSSGGGFDSYVGLESDSVSVTLRSLINVANGGAFSGVLTGGNGRAPGEGQIAYYEFNVSPGHSSITANVSLTNDAGDPVGSYLVSPDGIALGFGQNLLPSGTANGLSLTANTVNPIPGTWTLIVDFAEPVVGDEISQPFTGNIKLDQVSATAPALPNDASTKLKAGVPVTVPVTITNNGAAPEAFFVDARLNSKTSVLLPSAFGLPNNYEYALPLNSYYPLWLVPTQTSSVHLVANGNVPIVFDYSPFPGDPDLLGAPTTPNNAAGSYTPAGGIVEPGYWESLPSEIGPYPAGGAPPGLVVETITATLNPFDPAVSSPTGDFWFTSLNPAYGGFAPVILNPGQSAKVQVTITPSGSSGTVVSGNLFIDDYLSAVPPYVQTTGNEVAVIPYTYTIK
jgi:hypothetical protein